MTTEIQIKPTKQHARKIIALLSHGLTSGLGRQEPGKMCVEAAVCFAFGLPHGDNPPCVGSAVQAFKIRLNDCDWPDEMARAEGMKRLAVAQLGSDEIDQTQFGETMFLRSVQKILPWVWRKEAERQPENKRSEMLGWCEKMESVKTLEEANRVAKSAYAYASASASAAAYASAAYAYAYAAAASDAAYASAAYAYAPASAASAYASASASAASASASASAHRLELLNLTAKLALEVLIEMKSPGCKWLSLFDEVK